MLLYLGIKFADANKSCEGALLIASETGDRQCEARCYNYLGNLFYRLGDAVKDKEHYRHGNNDFIIIIYYYYEKASM